MNQKAKEKAESMVLTETLDLNLTFLALET